MNADTPTQLFANIWLAPVASQLMLPTNAKDGMLIWVEDEERIYLRAHGHWSPQR